MENAAITTVITEDSHHFQSKIMRFIATPMVKLENKLETAERDLKGARFHLSIPSPSLIDLCSPPAAKETTVNCREDASNAEKVFGDASQTLFGLLQELELERLDVVHSIGFNFLKQQK